MTDASREAFEAWARDERMTTGGLRGADNWCLWQAAVAWATAQHGDSHIGTGRPESVSGLGVEADSTLVPAQPALPADLVERAKAYYRGRVVYSFDIETVAPFAAAFAAEYAAEVTRDMASRFADDVAFWKERANCRSLYIDKLMARAEAAEQVPAPHAALIVMLKGALGEEREACAKVAEESADESNRRYEAKAGGEDGMGKNAARYRTAINIAAAIRARKWGEDV